MDAENVGIEAVNSLRLGTFRRVTRPRLSGILKTTDYVRSPVVQSELSDGEVSSSEEAEESTFLGTTVYRTCLAHHNSK